MLRFLLRFCLVILHNSEKSFLQFFPYLSLIQTFHDKIICFSIITKIKITSYPWPFITYFCSTCTNKSLQFSAILHEFWGSHSTSIGSGWPWIQWTFSDWASARLYDPSTQMLHFFGCMISSWGWRRSSYIIYGLVSVRSRWLAAFLNH